jgi:hypothetical protein
LLHTKLGGQQKGLVSPQPIGAVDGQQTASGVHTSPFGQHWVSPQQV